MLNGETQRRSLLRRRNEEIKILKVYFLEWESNLQSVAFTVTLLSPTVFLFYINLTEGMLRSSVTVTKTI